MIDEDELQAKNPAQRKNLEIMSVEALGEYIDALRAEIERAEAMIADKQSARGAADAVFKS